MSETDDELAAIVARQNVKNEERLRALRQKETDELERTQKQGAVKTEFETVTVPIIKGVIAKFNATLSQAKIRLNMEKVTRPQIVNGMASFEVIAQIDGSNARGSIKLFAKNDGDFLINYEFVPNAPSNVRTHIEDVSDGLIEAALLEYLKIIT